MELGLSLGEASTKAFHQAENLTGGRSSGLGFGFCMGLGVGPSCRRGDEEEEEGREEEGEESQEGDERGSADPPVQLSLLPMAPVPRYPSSQLGFPWAAETRNLQETTRGFDVNRAPSAEEMEEGLAVSTSPNSTVSSFQMDFSIYRGGGERGGAVTRSEAEAERASSRTSDEEENGLMLSRKKLRLSKDQSAFLEESFKEHNTLNPKQKLALAKQLNLRPRQVEVWFQNRRARTKLKQTEVDCEYLKRCCETLTEENRRLHKELHELRALKTSSHPYYMQLPATTLTMCPSCERVATTTTAAPPPDHHHHHHGAAAAKSSFASLLSKPRFYPFATHQPSAAS